jgi:hypothetical protein
MPARRLEDRIRELCARALYEKEPQWSTTIADLQIALQEHNLRIMNQAAVVRIAGQTNLIRERRRRGAFHPSAALKPPEPPLPIKPEK